MKSALFMILMFLAPHAWAGVQFEATVSANPISLDDNVTLTLTVTSDENIQVGDPHLPALEGWELAGKNSEEVSSSQIINGKFKFIRQQLHIYVLTPQREGDLAIGPAEIVVNGQSLLSKAIKVKVLPAGSVPPNAQQPGGVPQLPPGFPNPFGDDDEDDVFSQMLRNRGFNPNGRGGAKSNPPNAKEAFFVQVEVDKTKVYVGEQITASWYLYTTGAIRDYDALKYPSLNGFWKEDIELATRLNFQQETINGVAYNKALLLSYALFPLQAGRKNIDAYKAKATVISNDTGLSMFGIGRPYTYTKVSREVPIEVIPLPVEGKPKDFSGAVGSFDVVAQLSATSGKVNQPVSLKVKFQGEGNAKAIELPALNMPSSVEVYDTKSETKWFKTGQGYKDFEVLLIPRSAGDITIPPISTSWFDPKLKKYISKSTPAFTFHALPADGTSSPNANFPMANGENASVNLKKDILFIKTAPSSTIPLTPTAHWISWLGVLLSICAWFGWNLYRFNKAPESSVALAKKRAQARLKAARARLKSGDWRGVGLETHTAVLGVLGERVGVGGASLEASQLIDRLPPSTKQSLGLMLVKFLSQCETLSFAPEELVGSLKSEEQLKDLIAQGERLIVQILKDDAASQTASAAPFVSPS